jgi:hypothetical protein
MQLSGSHQAVIRQSSGSYNFVRQPKKTPAQAWTVKWQSSGSRQAVVRQSEKNLFFQIYFKTNSTWMDEGQTPMRTSEIRRSIFLGKTLGNSGKLWKTLGNSGKLWEALGSSGKLWETLGNSGKLWETLGNSGKLWETLWNSGKLWETLVFLWSNHLP